MKHYSGQFKQQVIEQYLCGYSIKYLSEQFHVSRITIRKWIQDWELDLSNKTLADLPVHSAGTILLHMETQRRQIDQATQTLNIIHESGVLQTIPRQERMNLAISLSDTYPVALLCDAFELNPSNLYYRRRQATVLTKCQKEKNELRKAICEAFENSGCRFGAERIRIQLQKQGFRVSKKRIIQLMKELHLSCENEPVSYYVPASPVEEIAKDEVNVEIL